MVTASLEARSGSLAEEAGAAAPRLLRRERMMMRGVDFIVVVKGFGASMNDGGGLWMRVRIRMRREGKPEKQFWAPLILIEEAKVSISHYRQLHHSQSVASPADKG